MRPSYDQLRPDLLYRPQLSYFIFSLTGGLARIIRRGGEKKLFVAFICRSSVMVLDTARK